MNRTRATALIGCAVVTIAAIGCGSKTTDKAAATSTTAMTALPTTTTSAPVETTVVTQTPQSKDRACEDATNDGAGNFDLLNSSVTDADGAYRFAATYVGPSEGRAVIIAFSLDGFEYEVAGKKIEDGSTYTFVFDFKSSKNTYTKDGSVADGAVSIRVPDELIERVADKGFTVKTVLEVDGSTVDECE